MIHAPEPSRGSDRDPHAHTPREHPAELPGEIPGAAVDRDGQRLNLLLSYGGWEDESWVDRIPALLKPMGVATHRAESARHASDVISRTRIHIAVVDLGLPFDTGTASAAPHEAGTKVLDLLRRLPNKPPSLVIKRSRTQREDTREMAAALRSGAFAVLNRPRETRELETLLEALRRCLVRHYGDQWPGTDTP